LAKRLAIVKAAEGANQRKTGVVRLLAGLFRSLLKGRRAKPVLCFFGIFPDAAFV
jgi:hypothetical protein